MVPAPDRFGGGGGIMTLVGGGIVECHRQRVQVAFVPRRGGGHGGGIDATGQEYDLGDIGDEMQLHGFSDDGIGFFQTDRTRSLQAGTDIPEPLKLRALGLLIDHRKGSAGYFFDIGPDCLGARYEAVPEKIPDALGIGPASSKTSFNQRSTFGSERERGASFH